jgi:hypothetical protein
MGRSRMVIYSLRIVTSDNTVSTPMEWRVGARHGIPGYGKPTTENIDKWVTAYEESLKSGGCNAHLGIHSVVSAKIVDQRTDTNVAYWERKLQRPNEPLFQVI